MDTAIKMQKAAALIQGVADLPTIPAVATRALSLLNQPDVDLDEVVELILTDQVMAARVLKMVNSPLYRPAREIGSLKAAVVYLGLRHIKEFMLTCSFIQSFEGKGGGPRCPALLGAFLRRRHRCQDHCREGRLP